MTNQSKPNYILRLDHQFPFEQFGKKWIMYLPGFEGMYAISEDLCVCSLDRICVDINDRKINYKAKLIKTLNSHKTGDGVLGCLEYRVVRKDINDGNKTGQVVFTKKKLLSLISSKNETKLKINFPFKYLDKIWIGHLQDRDGLILNHYLISDDVFVLRLNNSLDANLQTKHKVKKWRLSKGHQSTMVRSNDNGFPYVMKCISRSIVLNQVSKILEGMPDD